MQKLRISENGRFLVKEDGTPFIWLADTTWTVPARLKWDDVQYLYGAWFNPANGSVDIIKGKLPVSDNILRIRNSADDTLDRVLILADHPEKISVASGVYGDKRDDVQIRKVFEW